MNSLSVQHPTMSTMTLQLPQIDERSATRSSRSRSRSRRPYPEVDSGAYRAHFRRWWEDIGKEQHDRKEDAMDTIDNRLLEVHEMVTPRNAKAGTMGRLQTPLRNKVREFSIMTPGTFKRFRRSDLQTKFHPAAMFRNAIKLVLIAVTIYRRRRRYVQTGPVRGPLDSHVQSDDYAHSWMKAKASGNTNKNPTKTVIGTEFQCHFRTQPKYRTQEQLERIALKLRTIRAFQMFPTKVESELCRRIGYECYDDGRVLAYQGSKPHRFYYIISGQVRLLRTYKLQSGEVTKALGTLKRGHFTRREDLEKCAPSQCHMVCKGNLEVLILEIDDFLYLIDPPDPPPLGFLRSLPMFQDFPVEEFLNHPDAIRSKYFPPNKMVCEDANRTKWLYLVMSGECYCLRKQLITSDDFNSTQPLVGGGPLGENKRQRRPSHANEMIELSIARYVAKRRSSISHLPEIRTSLAEDVSEKGSVNPHGQTIGLPSLSRENTRSISPHGNYAHRTSMSYVDLPPLARSGLLMDEQEGRVSPNRQTTHSRQRRNSLFLTERSRTDASISRANTRERSRSYPAGKRHRDRKRGVEQKRPVFLQLGKLQSGEIFGLNEVAGTLRVEPSGVSVVSGGAEVIAISKRFFRQHAGVLTLLKLEGMLQEFVSEEDAKDLLEDEDTWKRYKKSMMDILATKKAEKAKDKRTTRMRLNPLATTV
ncbi:uncharacterized protein [Diadema antillarum]|uniref:uncharacterized protein n=1 Tax=Diadema antillarum TaxID=105358 RepID=UPI003A8C411F